MERLTYWHEECRVWTYKCPSSMVAHKLAAYEDTGLMPEAVEALKAELTRVTAERDALLEAAKYFGGCYACKYGEDQPQRCYMPGCKNQNKWQWRGTDKEVR